MDNKKRNKTENIVFVVFFIFIISVCLAAFFAMQSQNSDYYCTSYLSLNQKLDREKEKEISDKIKSNQFIDSLNKFIVDNNGTDSEIDTVVLEENYFPYLVSNNSNVVINAKFVTKEKNNCVALSNTYSIFFTDPSIINHLNLPRVAIINNYGYSFVNQRFDLGPFFAYSLLLINLLFTIWCFLVKKHEFNNQITYKGNLIIMRI